MEEKVRYPYPCEYYPKFDTQHEVAAFIRNYQAAGHIKKCAHVRIEHVGGGYSGPIRYRPTCRKDSFVVKRIPNPTYGTPSFFYGCPKDCLLYEPAWKEKTEKWLNVRWRSFREAIIGVAKWYVLHSALHGRDIAPRPQCALRKRRGCRPISRRICRWRSLSAGSKTWTSRPALRSRCLSRCANTSNTRSVLGALHSRSSG